MFAGALSEAGEGVSDNARDVGKEACGSIGSLDGVLGGGAEAVASAVGFEGVKTCSEPWVPAFGTWLCPMKKTTLAPAARTRISAQARIGIPATFTPRTSTFLGIEVVGTETIE